MVSDTAPDVRGAERGEIVRGGALTKTEHKGDYVGESKQIILISVKVSSIRWTVLSVIVRWDALDYKQRVP
jgi:hypothetical protein